MNFIFKLLLNGLAVYLSALLLNMLFPGVEPIVIKGYPIAIVVSIAIAIVNFTVRPILGFITLPVNVLTLGFFGFILNGVCILVVPWIVNTLITPNGFAIVGGSPLATLGWAIAYSMLVSFIQSTLQILVK